MSTAPVARPALADAGDALSLGILVASYHRGEDLTRCLAALSQQTHPADDVIVVMRGDDEQTRRAVEAFPPGLLPLRAVIVGAPGLIEARIAGCRACRTDVLAMVDDDAVPHPAWAERVMRHFRADPGVGGVGGRDRCHDGERFDETRADTVGKVQWFGRVIGNHHRGHGAAREVDVLKGANMSYRARVFDAVSFDRRLRGRGSQPCEDVCFSAAVRHAGWKLIYDPEAVVDHHLGRRDETRHYVGVAPLRDVEGFRDFAFNEAVALWDTLTPGRRLAFMAWSVLVGTRVCPGLAQAIRFTPGLGRMSWRRFAVAQRGKLAAFRMLLRAPSRRGRAVSHR